MNQPVTMDCWSEEQTVNRIEAVVDSLATPTVNDAVELTEVFNEDY